MGNSDNKLDETQSPKRSIASLVCAVFLILCFGEVAQAQTALQNPDARTYLSMDGEWSYIVDPYSTGDTDILGRPKADGYFLDLQANGPSDLLEYDFDAAPTMSIPASWTTEDPSLEFYEGIVWFRKRVDLDPDESKRYFIQLEAVNYSAEVYVNGIKLGRHEGAFTPFAFEATSQLSTGENSIVVRVEAERRADRMPATRMDWWNYAGITRSIRLVETPAFFVSNYSVKLAPDDTECIEVDLVFQGDATGQNVSVTIPELGVTKTITVSDVATASLSIPVKNLSLWSPDNPKLYRVEVSTNEELLVDDIGFRTFKASGRQLLLNGQPIFLRGISIHDERLGPKGGRITTPEQASDILEKAQDLGVNFIRLAHYPHNEFMLKEADKRGLLVWSEMPLYWGINWESETTLSAAKEQYSAMIARDINRASIVIWSIANETVNTPERLSFLSDLAQHVRSLDNSRLIAAALLPDYSEAAISKMVAKVSSIIDEEPIQSHQVVVDDPLGAQIDIVALNQYYGWYYSRPIAAAIGQPVDVVRNAFIKLIPDLRFDNAFGKPMVISEFGAGAVSGRRGEVMEVWTEDFQENLYKAQMCMMAHNMHLQGLSPWVFKDFRSPMRPLHGVQNGWNLKGVISKSGDKKLAFDVLRSAYQKIETMGAENSQLAGSTCGLE